MHVPSELKTLINVIKDLQEKIIILEHQKKHEELNNSLLQVNLTRLERKIHQFVMNLSISDKWDEFEKKLGQEAEEESDYEI